MQIDLSKDEIHSLAGCCIPDKDVRLGKLMSEAVKRGHMEQHDLIEVAKWKSPSRPIWRLCSENTEDDVVEVSQVSFSAKSERLRIGVLLALKGVHWPMASVILHFAFPCCYPILDFRVMRTVDGSTSYNFERWWEYTQLCRSFAKDMDVTLRQLDRALWQYDKRQ